MKFIKDLDIFDIIITVFLLILWIILFLFNDLFSIETYKISIIFTGLVSSTIGLILYRVKPFKSWNIWIRFIIHSIFLVFLSTIYIFNNNNSPLSDSITINIWFLLILLIQYSYENNKYYGE